MYHMIIVSMQVPLFMLDSSISYNELFYAILRFSRAHCYYRRKLEY